MPRRRSSRSAGMPRSRSCSWIAIRPPPVPPSAAPDAVRDEPVQAQQRLAVRGAERVPALARPGEQVEVVLVGVGVVEVAGRAVRCAAGVSARRTSRGRRALAAPGERPRGRQPHHSAADHHDGHAFAHPSIFAVVVRAREPPRRPLGAHELRGVGCRRGIRLDLGRDRGRPARGQPQRGDLAAARSTAAPTRTAGRAAST